MPAKINLLPPQLATKGELGKIGKIANTLGITVVCLFIIFAGLAGGLLFISSSQLEEEAKKEAVLSSRVKQLNTTEQKLFLIKDRIAKIKEVIADTTGVDTATKVGDISVGFGTEVAITDTSFQGGKITIDLTAKSTAGMLSVFNYLGNTTGLRQVTLKEFSFSPEGGYQFGLEIL